MAPFRILLNPCPIIRPCKRSSSYVTSRTRKTRFSIVQWACSRASASSGVKGQGKAAPAIQTWQRVASRPARQRVRSIQPHHCAPGQAHACSSYGLRSPHGAIHSDRRAPRPWRVTVCTRSGARASGIPIQFTRA